MSTYTHDDPALRIRITERLAMARAQAARLRPDDKELRGRLRPQLDEMLADWDDLVVVRRRPTCESCRLEWCARPESNRRPPA